MEKDQEQPSRTVCIVNAAGKLGQYMIDICLKKGYQVHGVCRKKSVEKLDAYKDKITIFPGDTDDTDVISDAVKDCDAVLTSLVPYGMAEGTAQAILAHADSDARLIFACGTHMTPDGKDKFSWTEKAMFAVLRWGLKAVGYAELQDTERACDHVFKSDSKWTVCRGGWLEEGESEGMPVWTPHTHDPLFKDALLRRVDYAGFMVAAIDDAELVQKAPCVTGCNTKAVKKHMKKNAEE